MKRRILIALLAAAAVTFVGVFYHFTKPSIDGDDAEALLDFADQQSLKFIAGAPIEVPESMWPTAIKRLNPQKVKVTADGMFIRRNGFFVMEWGWFVLPTGSLFVPDASGDPSFRPLIGRVFSYDIAG